MDTLTTADPLTADRVDQLRVEWDAGDRDGPRADPATVSNTLIVVGAVLVAVALAGIVGLLWCVAGGLFAGLLVAGVEAVVAGIAVGRASA